MAERSRRNVAKAVRLRRARHTPARAMPHLCRKDAGHPADLMSFVGGTSFATLHGGLP